MQEVGAPEESMIKELALSWGIEQEYTDNWGKICRTSLDINKALLKAMGVIGANNGDLKGALEARAQRRYSRLTDPTIVVSKHTLPENLVFRIAMDTEFATRKLTSVALCIEDENGSTKKVSYAKKDIRFLETIKLGDIIYHQWGVSFPQLDTIGYYKFELLVEAEDWRKSQNVFVVICPEKAYLPPALEGKRRSAGISISLYGVRSERNWGVGDFGDLKKIIDWVSEDLRGNIIGLNPLHATFNRSPFNTSPYLPISRFYRNYIYLDIASLEDYEDCPMAQSIVKRYETQELLIELRKSERVQYEKVGELKERILRVVFKEFLNHHWEKGVVKTKRQKEFEDYIKKEGRLLTYFATFCALDSIMHQRDPRVWIWSQWPQEYKHPETGAVHQFQREHRDEILFYKYVQWQLEKQLIQVQEYAKKWNMSIGLYPDLALAIDRFGADFWAYQDYFIPKVRVGAPPDAFSQHGQDWGFPPPNIEKLKENGYDIFIDEVRKNCSFCGALRIDHVMRLFRLYCIPEGKPPSEGGYILQPYEDLLKILALESVRNQVVIIGEDLGTVPQYIRDRLVEANVLSYRLLYFEKNENQDFIKPSNYPELALVTISTHDLPTLAGFWTHKDIDVRETLGIFDGPDAIEEAIQDRRTDQGKLLKLSKELGILENHFTNAPEDYPEITGKLHNAFVGFLALTPSKLFVLSQEDLFKAKDQQNIPGTTSEYPNWSLKMKYTVEQLCTDPQVQDFSKMFRTWVERSGRL